jgi:hypothetical protein
MISCQYPGQKYCDLNRDKARWVTQRFLCVFICSTAWHVIIAVACAARSAAGSGHTQEQGMGGSNARCVVCILLYSYNDQLGLHNFSNHY